jgi:hypothetical protein
VDSGDHGMILFLLLLACAAGWNVMLGQAGAAAWW